MSIVGGSRVAWIRGAWVSKWGYSVVVPRYINYPSTMQLACRGSRDGMTLIDELSHKMSAIGSTVIIRLVKVPHPSGLCAIIGCFSCFFRWTTTATQCPAVLNSFVFMVKGGMEGERGCQPVQWLLRLRRPRQRMHSRGETPMVVGGDISGIFDNIRNFPRF